MSVSLLVATNALVAAVYAPPADVALPDYAGPVVVDWGDGTAVEAVLLGVPGASLPHGYALGGDYTIVATGRLANGARYEQSLTVTVPSVTADVPMVDQGIAGELPADGPATVAGVKDQGDLSVSGVNDAKLQRVVDAVNKQIRRWPTADRSRGQAAWNPDTVLGANMLAVRFWRRKDTPGGVEVYGDFGIAYVRRLDPDVAQLLELGDWSRPKAR